jgi:ferrochelatase
MAFKGQTSYEHQDNPQKKGVLLVNLGTPDAPNSGSLRKYLREFLSDPRVIEIPRILWLIILYCFILPLRPKRSAKLYQSVWTDQGSPLLVLTKQQRQALKDKCDLEYGVDKMPIAMGMRYGTPSIKTALKELAEKNVRDITILPLYPQYCAATTGSTFDGIAKQLTSYRWVPSIRFISGYHKHPLYIQALAKTITDYIEKSGMPDKFIFSYHGIPLRYLQQGDPYFCFCTQTTRLVSEHLGMDDALVMTTFQSRFGKAQWLQPYTDVTLKSLASEGTEHVAIICPGFAADCLETLEEIMEENKAYFMQSGGKVYDYIPCLNNADDHIDMMFALIGKN